MSTADAQRLWKQSERDLAHGEADYSGAYYEWACNSARQAGEKILKALFHHFGLKQPLGAISHSSQWLLGELKRNKPSLIIPWNIQNAAWKIDNIEYQNDAGQTTCCTVAQTEYFDTPTLGNNAPYEIIGEPQARARLDAATEIVEWAKTLLQTSP